MIGKAVVTGKRVVLFGDGVDPKNFVAAADVAKLIVFALSDERMRGQAIDIGGPENLTSLQVVETFERVAGASARVTHIPLRALRVLAWALRPVHQGVSRIMHVMAVAETTDQRFEPASLHARFPLTLTRLEDWAQSRG